MPTHLALVLFLFLFLFEGPHECLVVISKKGKIYRSIRLDFFVSLRLCSSYLLLSATTYFVVRLLSACVICTLRTPSRNYFVFIRLVFFFSYLVALVSRVAFGFCCALVPGTLALDLPTLILKRLFFLCLTVTT